MLDTTSRVTPKQRLFSVLFMNTLIYAVVLGFFNDYTTIVYAKSFSYIVYASVVLALMTYGAFWLNGKIVKRFGATRKAVMVFGVWLVLFLSKFVFVWVIDVIFGNDVNVYGFFGILAVVACVTIVTKLAEYTYDRLGR